MSRGKILLALIFLISIFSKCTSFGIASKENIIQKSATSRPYWADLESGERFNDWKNADKITLVYVKTNITRLDLGIKQAQLQAVHVAPNLLLEEIESFFLSVAKKSGTYKAIEQKRSDLKKMLRESGSSSQTLEANPKAVYWEQIQKEDLEGTRSWFRVFILLYVPRGEWDFVVGRLLKKMKAHSSEDFKKLADSVTNFLQS